MGENILLIPSKDQTTKRSNNIIEKTKRKAFEKSLISNSIVQNFVNKRKTNIEYKNKQANDKFTIFLCFLYFKNINLRIFFCNSKLTFHIKNIINNKQLNYTQKIFPVKFSTRKIQKFLIINF